MCNENIHDFVRCYSLQCIQEAELAAAIETARLEKEKFERAESVRAAAGMRNFSPIVNVELVGVIQY